MFTRIPKEIHEEVVTKAKAGEKVAELSKTYGISTKTIYGWLSKDGGDDSVSMVKHNKLKRENEELKRILGEITLELRWGKKGRNGQNLN